MDKRPNGETHTSPTLAGTGQLITQHTEVVSGERENDWVCGLGLCFGGSVPLRAGQRKSL